MLDPLPYARWTTVVAVLESACISDESQVAGIKTQSVISPWHAYYRIMFQFGI